MFSVGEEDDDGIWNELLEILEKNSNEGDSSIPTSYSEQSSFHGSAGGTYTPTVSLPVLPAPHSATERNQSGVKRAPRRSASRGKRVRDADKVKEMEALAALQMDQFAALVQRNAELKFKNQILSDVVMLRDFQIELTKGGPKGASPLALAAAAVSGGGTLGSNPMLPAASVAQAVWTPGSVRLLLVPEPLPGMVDCETLRAITRSELVAHWKAFLSEASAQLLVLEDNPGNEAAAVRMRDATAQISSLMRSANMFAPAAMISFFQTHLETNTLVAPDSGHWLRVLQTLQLTEEQLRDLRAVHDLFNRIMQEVLAERRALQEQLARGMDVNVGATSTFLLSPEVQVLPALERNMRKEESAHILLRGFLFGRTLSILQMCRVAVHSYPFFPNATALVATAAGLQA